MKGLFSLLGAVYLITTSFYLSPEKKEIKKENISTKKIERLADTKPEKNTRSSSEELFKAITFEPGHET
ncbi:hypothetical protein J3D55_000655 [Chryseobacterium ginsenosidimutans]|uniref:hypothetical protein n=1 Tax=Chryseobacterium ginsenosidimutans TaxID=687846 RepID=UPI002169E71C|nr:hypothetical protein [Chryseobacterium ginsenosidimutans]MCS3867739.1 hypothetical protein [Chryseobacterium ginsenosidimutans]